MGEGDRQVHAGEEPRGHTPLTDDAQVERLRKVLAQLEQVTAEVESIVDERIERRRHEGE